ncbi:helix-turn-helix domain-containing protein [Pseudomonas sp. RW10S2]|uniref:ArsR/SmtB family transcription factor n=1 Tax=Pseudomonas sp. RW10S2 TaxID=459637 RepID=UPI001647D93B|nr:helix-turn-helix domain-containing protein [Pseudomonas sp. RW10S2]MBC3466844.1 helix-turn-helix transcriptional regulator [Pseudomonas sp. RW10S2]
MTDADHPKRRDIRLESVLAALGSPLRLAALRMIAEGGEHPCNAVLPTVKKSTLTHHFRILRDSGVVWQRRVGQSYQLSLRREDLDARFPGLLDAILAPLQYDPLTRASLSDYAA